MTAYRQIITDIISHIRNTTKQHNRNNPRTEAKKQNSRMEFPTLLVLLTKNPTTEGERQKVIRKLKKEILDFEKEVVSQGRLVQTHDEYTQSIQRKSTLERIRFHEVDHTKEAFENDAASKWTYQRKLSSIGGNYAEGHFSFFFIF